jgi:hypothetical protein
MTDTIEIYTPTTVVEVIPTGDRGAAWTQLQALVLAAQEAVSAVTGQKGVAGGLAPLDGAAKVPLVHLPSLVAGSEDQVQINRGGAFAGTPHLAVSAAGLIRIGGATNAFPALRRNGTGLDVRLADDSGYADVTAQALKLDGGNTAIDSSSFVIWLRAGGALRGCVDGGGFSSTAYRFGADPASPHTTLTHGGPGILEQRNGANGQTLRLYGTYIDSSNNSRLNITAAANGATSILASAAGTGPSGYLLIGTQAVSSLFLMTSGVTRWEINAPNGHFLANIDNAYDIGEPMHARPRNAYIGTKLVIGAGFGADAGTLKVIGASGGVYCATFSDNLVSTLAISHSAVDGTNNGANVFGTVGSSLTLGANDVRGLWILDSTGYALRPGANNAYDIGTAARKVRDGYFAGRVTANSVVKGVFGAGGLGTASPAGVEAFCNDATMTHAAGLGTVVVGGGTNFVPVYSDGTNWRIG